MRLFMLPDCVFVGELSWQLKNQQPVIGKGRTPTEAVKNLGIKLEQQLNGSNRSR
jgi:hypothetical protein